MGKSDEQLKKRQKDTFKSPISPIWLSEFLKPLDLVLVRYAQRLILLFFAQFSSASLSSAAWSSRSCLASSPRLQARCLPLVPHTLGMEKVTSRANKMCTAVRELRRRRSKAR